MLPFQAPSVLTSWTRTILDALVDKGIDASAVLDEAGIGLEEFSDPNGRFPASSSDRLWGVATRHAKDPAFGLSVSHYVKYTTFHGLGFAMMASSTLREALQRLVRYNHVVTDATDLRLDVSGTSARLTLLVADGHPPPAPEAIDAAMSLMVRTCRFLTARTFAPIDVEQTRPAPADPEPYTTFFGCPVRFSAPFEALTFDARVLDRPIEMSNPELARLNDEAVRAYLERVKTGSVVDQVRARLATRLTDRPTPASVAKGLGLSQRSLQRRLKERGTSYEEILTEVRKDLACEYLRQERYSITELAFILGFEDASAFARAFRRWMGKSPSCFRAELEPPAQKRALI
jgi:AraC-like DNA-binding protein